MTRTEGTAEPQFTRVTGTNLFWLDGSGRTIGFQSGPGAPIGDNPTLSRTWGEDPRGIYFFLPEAPVASDQDFAASLRSYLETRGWPSGYQKFLWLQNPNAPIST